MTPKIINIIGSNGSITANGIITNESKPENMPSGIINTTAKIKDNNRNIIFMGMLNKYNPAEKTFNSIITPNTKKAMKTNSILNTFYIFYLNINTELID